LCTNLLSCAVGDEHRRERLEPRRCWQYLGRAPVHLLQGTFVGELAILLGVAIGPRAMVAAGSVVSRDFGEGVLVAGNPARIYGQ
jgi:maltose O-acetyltransferase